MKTKTFIVNLVFLLLVFFSCFSQEKSTLVVINPEIEKTLNKEQMHIIELWDTSLREYSLDSLPKYWSLTQKKIAKFPQYEIGMLFLKNRNWESLIPLVLSVQKVEDFYILKTAFVEKNNNVKAIYNVVVKKEFDTFEFFNYFWFFKDKYSHKSYKEVDYFFKKDYDFNLENAEKMHQFHLYLSRFFKSDLIPYNYYLFKNSEEMYREFGFDYNLHMFDSFQKGGAADVNFNAKKTSVFSGNGSEIFEHEAVHVYLDTVYGDKIHSFFNEGAATWLGGALGYDLNYQMKFFQEYIKNNEIDFNDFLNEKYFITTDDINTKYSIGALICKLAYDKEGMIGLERLLKAGDTDADCYLIIEEMFGVNQLEFDSFIKNEIKNYKE